MQKPSKRLLWLIYLVSLLRLLLGMSVELGNDEAYYHTYAAYPALSHFDHPPMVGFVIWFFSFGGYLQHQLWMRIGSIILAAINTFLIWQIGYKLKNQTAAWYAALLFTASFYTSLIAGVFIMPDSPQVFFWLTSLWLMVSLSKADEVNTKSKKQMIALGGSIGLAMLSKYTSVYLWFGFLVFLLLHQRQWFKSASLYLAGILSLLVFSPVIYWNYQNNFISFTFHQERVNMSANSLLHWNYLGTEIGGAVLYQNPFVFLLIVIVLTSIVLGKTKDLKKQDNSLLLWLSVPLIVSFLGISLFKRTLPHWTGPAYITLILLTATYITARKNKSKLPFTLITVFAILLFTIGSITAGYQVNRGIVPLEKWGNDPTLDMYGWQYLGTRFKQISADIDYVQELPQQTPILATNWFDAAHLDYYIAPSANTYVMAWGPLTRIHKYAWINKTKGNMVPGMNMWYISFNGIQKIRQFQEFFQTIEFVSNIPIYRHNKKVKEANVFLLKELKYSPGFDWQSTSLY